MKVLIAHSSEKQIYRLAKSLESIGLSQLYTTDDGFDALENIVRHNCRICIIEEHLTGLNALDIIKAMSFKGIAIKYIILSSGENPDTLKHKNILAKIDLVDKGALPEILNILKRELQPVNLR